jgi:hypothetical protein
VAKAKHIRLWTALLAMLLAMSLLVLAKPAQTQEAIPGAVENLQGCLANTLPANDDGSTAEVPLPFTVNFFGSNYGSLYVNNNGNVTFDGQLSTFTPYELLSTNQVIIAPFFADVDTRGAGSGEVTYGNVTFEGRDAFCVNWVDVGYYDAHTDKLNSFQLLLVDRSDVQAGDFDILFNYDKIQWETGDASGGSGGLGGSSARAGYSYGGGGGGGEDPCNDDIDNDEDGAFDEDDECLGGDDPFDGGDNVDNDDDLAVDEDDEIFIEPSRDDIDNDGDGHVDEDDESLTGDDPLDGGDDVDNDEDGAVDEDDETDIGEFQTQSLSPSSERYQNAKEKAAERGEDVGSSSVGLNAAFSTQAASQGVSLELSGSGVNGAFLDSNPSGLIHGSRDSFVLGRYIFPVRNGDAPVGASISGHVFENDSSNPLGGALVQVCQQNSCNTTSTNANGEYEVSGLADGDYNVRAFPPSNSNVNPGEIGPITITGGQSLTDQDIVLRGPQPPPPDTSIDEDTPAGEIPVVIVGQPVHLETTGCEGGTATYEVTGEYGGNISGSMTEGPPGTYTAEFSIPFVGPADVSITIDCPAGTDDEVTEFNIYIDPSGNVRTVDGDPIQGATVTLFRSETGTEGSFVQVPDGDAIMSPSNRANPDTTDAAGHFGWDVIAGFYKVRAEKEGCVSPSDPNQAFVESAVLTIPPPVTDLDLRLDCPEPDETDPTVSITTPPDGAVYALNEAVNADYSCDDEAGGSGLASCDGTVPDGQPIDTGSPGAHEFTVTATDNAGNTSSVTHSYTVDGCSIIGTGGDDVLEGTAGSDVICGLGGNDTLRGGDGPDRLSGGGGDDTLDGGAGYDSASYKDSATAISASLLSGSATGEGSDTLASIRRLFGSPLGDTLEGSQGADKLKGFGGADEISGLGGDDQLSGKSGADTVRGGDDKDTVAGGSNPDALFGEAGDDSLDSQDGKEGNDEVDGGDGTDTCTTDATERSIVNCEP